MGKPNKKDPASKKLVTRRYNNNDADSDNEGETEMLSLKLRYHNLEGNKQAYEKETQEEIRRQRQLIRQLQEEREEISTNLKGASGKNGVTQEHKTTGAIRSLLEKGDDIDAKIAEEKQRHSELDEEIKETQRKLEQNRKAAALKEDTNKKAQRLTAQVAQGNSKFSSLLSANSKLREEIETMRVEKEKFQLLYKKLQKTMEEVRQESRGVLDEATEAYHTREEAQARIIRVNEQQEKDMELYNAEIREMQRELSHAQKVEHFLQEKKKEREPDDNFLEAEKKRETKERERKIEHQIALNKYEEAVEKLNEIIEKGAKKRDMSQRQMSKSDNKNGYEGAAEEERKRLWDLATRRKSTILSPFFKDSAGDGDSERKLRRVIEHRRKSTIMGTTTEDQERLRELMKKALEHQDKLEEKDSLDSDAELFYNVYMEREDMNFALFNYVTEQTSDIDSIQEQIEQLKMNISFLRDKDFAVSDEHKNIMKELELKTTEATEASNKSETEVGRREKIWGQIKTAVHNLGKKIGVNTTEFSVTLGGTDEPTNHNIITYLGIVEQRASEILAACSYRKYQDAERSEDTSTSVLEFLGVSPPKAMPEYEVQLPSTGLLDSEDEEMTGDHLRPLSKAELQQKALQSIQMKEDGSKDKNEKTIHEKNSNTNRRTKVN
ncbi:coiled-coil domain-containing protein 63-like isoform X1 [Polyodon spathula]|uniref:coiled-coil domain-containing protein 63-like isoform X1 n=1 Tax=Polyodon spathula TaxID=7913 RepID=UPI001B7F56CC|nr:coiled-coil domain-containing protein 63-like isoform X1 [Polyodon spathula]